MANKKKAASSRSSKKLVKTNGTSSDLLIQLGEDIWPNEQEFFERPERFKYVRKIIKPKGCVFCEAAKKGVSSESLVLYKNENAMAVLNKFPYNNGHLLVLPVQHIGDMQELSDMQYADLMVLFKKSCEIVCRVYECHGFNAGINHGRVAGAGIPDHLHFHIVPRWSGDTNFFPLIGQTKVLPELVEQSYRRLIKEFNDLEV